jgi:hypothetical protein
MATLRRIMMKRKLTNCPKNKKVISKTANNSIVPKTIEECRESQNSSIAEQISSWEELASLVPSMKEQEDSLKEMFLAMGILDV